MLGSEEQLRFFDINGKGFDEMTGCYLCDGRNGTPDLRGRVANGRHHDGMIIELAIMVVLIKYN